MRLSARLLLATLVAAAACDESPTDPPPATIATVEIAARATSLMAGDTLHLTAAVTNSAGAAVPGAAVTWSSSDTTVATVGADGVLRARSGGTARITAQARGRSDALDVTVATPAVDRTPAPGYRHTCALNAQGVAYCWGGNGSGQVGVPPSDSVRTPTPVQTSLRFVALAAGGFSTCGIATDGRLWCWGTFQGGAVPSHTPRLVGGDVAFQSLSIRNEHLCALSRTGDVWCAGSNHLRSLGPGTAAFWSETAVQVPGLKAVAVTAGGAHSCAITTAGATLCWGLNDYGQAGPASPKACNSNSVECTPTPQPIAGGHTFTSLVAGGAWTCGLTAAGTVYCWGSAPESSAPSPTPMLMAGGAAFTRITGGSGGHLCGMRADGKVLCWGRNYFGQLGNGTHNVGPNPPAEVTGLPALQSVAAGSEHTCGVTAAGTLYCWGLNEHRRLGATTTERCTFNSPCATTPRPVENWPPA